MKKLTIKVKKEEGYEDLPLPVYQSSGASGLDLHAAIDKAITLRPGDIRLISSGIRISVPPGYEGQVRPRSGMAAKHGIGVLNSPGTIDSDYRGIVGVILFNFGNRPVVIKRGDRIAQLVVSKYERIMLTEVDQLDGSERESGGFGSTGN